MILNRESTGERPLRIEIQSSDFSVTPALRRHAERRLRFALTFCEYHLQRIVVRLSDVKGASGGPAKCCHLQVMLIGDGNVVVEDIEGDLYVAIGRAASRAARTVRRRLTRRRDRARTVGIQQPRNWSNENQLRD